MCEFATLSPKPMALLEKGRWNMEDLRKCNLSTHVSWATSLGTYIILLPPPTRVVNPPDSKEHGSSENGENLAEDDGVSGDGSSDDDDHDAVNQATLVFAWSYAGMVTAKSFWITRL